MNELQRTGWIFLLICFVNIFFERGFMAFFFLFLSIQHFFAHYCIEAYFKKKRIEKEQPND